MNAVAQPFHLKGQEVFVTVSMGAALFPGDGEDAGVLIRNADAAMYRAKETGRNNYQYYTAAMNERTRNRLQLESSLRRALERSEFALHYQPKVDLRTGEIVGVEALLRWNHPERGLVSPIEFIPLLEDTGMIVPVGEWVLRTACEQVRQWHDAGLGPLRVAVNHSAREFQQENFSVIVSRTVREAGANPKWLDVEITESMLMDKPQEIAATLQKLKTSGAHISVDDFGTGYSSLSYLTRYAPDAVKIDRSFVRNVHTDPGNAAIALTVIRMAHSLGMKVVAEGVEDESQLGFLRANRCDEIQGYLVSRPMSAEDCTRFLASGWRLPAIAAERDLAPRNLLLVDDEPNILNALTRVLNRDGYRILVAQTASEAFDQLAINEVAVVIADQRMPDITGVELLKRVRKLYPDTVRIILSGYADLKTVIDSINTGAVYKFLSKPWDDDQLRAVTADAFRYFELTRERRPPAERNGLTA